MSPAVARMVWLHPQTPVSPHISVGGGAGRGCRGPRLRHRITSALRPRPRSLASQALPSGREGRMQETGLSVFPRPSPHSREHLVTNICPSPLSHSRGQPRTHLPPPPAPAPSVPCLARAAGRFPRSSARSPGSHLPGRVPWRGMLSGSARPEQSRGTSLLQAQSY